jgi:hypothetical protein
MNRQQRIKKMGEPDTVSLRGQPEEFAVSVKAPGSTGSDHFYHDFLITVKKYIIGPASRISVG